MATDFRFGENLLNGVNGILDPSASLVQDINEKKYLDHWKDEFYEFFYLGMENAYQKNAQGLSTNKDLKVKTTLLNTLFYRYSDEERILSQLNNTLAGSPIFVSPTTDSGIRTIIHYIKNINNNNIVLPTLINYNKTIYSEINKTPTISIKGGLNDDGAEDPKLKDELSFNSLYNIRQRGNLYPEWNIDKESADFKSKGHPFLRNPDGTLNTSIRRLGYERFNNTTIDSLGLKKLQAETYNQRLSNAIREKEMYIAFNSSIEGKKINTELKYAWNTLSYNDAYKTKEDLNDIYDISTRNIIKRFQQPSLKNMSLRPEDFIFHSKYPSISNNKLVVLRRYALPVGNNPLYTPDNMPISTLVTYLEENTKIGLQPGMSWTDHNESLQKLISKITGIKDNPVSTIIELITDSFTNQKSLKSAQQQNLGTIFTEDYMLEKIYNLLGLTYAPGLLGNTKQNPNLVQSTKKLTVGAQGSFTFVFKASYEMKYFPGIDLEQTIMDIIANILTMTSNDRVSYLNPQTLDNYKTFLDMIQSKKSPVEFISNIAKNLNFENVKNAFDFADNFAYNTYKVANYYYSTYERDIKATLAASMGLPNATYHLTIGNPNKPIISIGNLYPTSVTISLDTDILNHQDMPMKIDVSINLTNATPLGRQDFENILNGGFGRIYNDVSNIKDKTWNSYAANQDDINNIESNLRGDIGTLTDITKNVLESGKRIINTPPTNPSAL